MGDVQRDEPWAFYALCRGMDTNLFFPVKGGRGGLVIDASVTEACDSCPVSPECLEDAIEQRAGGIRAGTTAKQRKLKREAGLPRLSVLPRLGAEEREMRAQANLFGVGR